MFISWSGERSKAAAKLLREWLTKLIPTLEPWMSDIDIAPGTRWAKRIYDKIRESRFAIICVTRDNSNSPWLMFESGELSRTLAPASVSADGTTTSGDGSIGASVGQTYLDVPVCPFLVDFDGFELTGPLAQFQVCHADEQGVRKLVNSLCELLDPQTRSNLFPFVEFNFGKLWWPNFKRELGELPAARSTFTGIFEPGSDFEFIENLARVGFDKFRSIEVVAHTGKVLVNSLLDRLEEQNFRGFDDLDIKVLLRNPRQETAHRARLTEEIARRIGDCQRLGYDGLRLHYYDNLPVFRSIIARPKCSKGCTHAYLGYYYFPDNRGPSKRFPGTLSFVTQLDPQRVADADDKPKETAEPRIDVEPTCMAISPPPAQEKGGTEASLIRVRQSWFDAYWGKPCPGGGYRVIHSIVFDFDDTLVRSCEAQIDAWVCAVLLAVHANGIDVLAKDICKPLERDLNSVKTDLLKSNPRFPRLAAIFRDWHAKRPAAVEVDGLSVPIAEFLVEFQLVLKEKLLTKLREKISRLFFEFQVAEVILPMIIGQVDDARRDEFDRQRKEFRKLLTDDAHFFAGAHEALQRLSQDYHLIVVSKTDEDMIRRYLRKQNVEGLFRHVFGRGEASRYPRGDKKDVLEQTVGILGVPRQRLVFIGDNDGDRKAAADAKIDFIEARLLGTRLSELWSDDELRPKTLIRARQEIGWDKPASQTDGGSKKDVETGQFFDSWTDGPEGAKNSLTQALNQIERIKAREYPFGGVQR